MVSQAVGGLEPPSPPLRSATVHQITFFLQRLRLKRMYVRLARRGEAQYMACECSCTPPKKEKTVVVVKF